MNALQYARYQAIQAHADIMKHILKDALGKGKKKEKARRKLDRASGRITAYQDIIEHLTGIPQPKGATEEYHDWLVAQGIVAPGYRFPDGSYWQAKDAKPYGLFVEDAS
jgi:hypothetical protein